MKRRVNLESVAGAAVVAIALGAAVLALRFPAAKGAVPGPAMFPLLIAGLWAALGVALLAIGLRGTWPAVKEAARPHRALALLALTFAYTAVMPKLGFIATSALFLTLAVRLLGYQHGWRAGALGLSVAFVVYGLFARVMNVPLPAGWLG
jgi:putative tricarboxylic transport membrane protein